LSCVAAPVGDGIRFGKACLAGKKMVLPCANGPFGGACAMDVRSSVLNASLFNGDKSFDVC
jgi:hypothetical protein